MLLIMRWSTVYIDNDDLWYRFNKRYEGSGMTEREMFDMYRKCTDVSLLCKTFESTDPKIVYYVIDEKIKTSQLLKSAESFYVWKRVPTIDGHINYIYEMHLRTPITPADRSMVKASNIKKIRLVYDPWSNDTGHPERTGIKIPKTIDMSDLKNFMSKPYQDLEVIASLKKIGLVPSKPVRAYRGLTFRDEDELPSYLKRPSVGQTVDMNDTRAQSWTTNVCVALAFGSNMPLGVVYETILKPSQIIIDMRMLDDEQRKELYAYGRQNEIIAKAGKKRVTVKFLQKSAMPLVFEAPPSSRSIDVS